MCIRRFSALSPDLNPTEHLREEPEHRLNPRPPLLPSDPDLTNDPPAAKLVAAASSMLDPVMTVPPAVETGLSRGNSGATVAKPTGDKAGTSDPAKSDKEMSEPTSEPPVQISQVEELESSLDVDFKDNGDSDAETEAEPVFKVPTKHKKKSRSKSNKQAKKHESDVEESDGGSTDSSWSQCSQSDEREIVHTAAEISAFLKNTKGKSAGVPRNLDAAKPRARTSPPPAPPVFKISTQNRFAPLRETECDAVIIRDSIVWHVPAILNKNIGAVVLHAGMNDIRLRQTKILKKDFRSLVDKKYRQA
ncbi:hypothetical protein QTP70_011189 [Hemibagrus guttatus]|uniref:Uncharacterized protein n=1 Tax=Hemibagrus guttatus TaxID=175788 RepID=A0AAE0QQ96_9TELE|nr:hypothetical protein QTP70_011189 [Hemibagrus guttatus]